MYLSFHLKPLSCFVNNTKKAETYDPMVAQRVASPELPPFDNWLKPGKAEAKMSTLESMVVEESREPEKPIDREKV